MRQPGQMEAGAGRDACTPTAGKDFPGGKRTASRAAGQSREKLVPQPQADFALGLRTAK